MNRIIANFHTMTTSFRKTYLSALALFLVALFMLPLFALAHDNHSPGAPAHPVGSPDFHEVETTDTATDAAATPVGSAEQQTLLALLLRLLALFEAQLAELAGEEVGVMDTEDAVVSTAATTGIETTGDLTMTTDSNYRYFMSDGLPEYSTAGNRYANTPSAQDHDFRVALNPQKNDNPTYYELPYTFGIALNGVTFEPFAAEWYQNDRDSGWQEDPFVTLPDLDSYNAHVQPSGLYHYHGQPTNLMEGDFDTHSTVLGFAADGFPLYGPYVYFEADDPESDITRINSSYELKSGTRPDGPGGTYDGTYNEDYEYSEWGSNSLDECNGRFGVTPEYPDGTYYYVATEGFPYIPRCLMGDMDPSFAAGPPGR